MTKRLDVHGCGTFSCYAGRCYATGRKSQVSNPHPYFLAEQGLALVLSNSDTLTQLELLSSCLSAALYLELLKHALCVQ
jgi:hypothetical protein